MRQSLRAFLTNTVHSSSTIDMGIQSMWSSRMYREKKPSAYRDATSCSVPVWMSMRPTDALSASKCCGCR